MSNVVEKGSDTVNENAKFDNTSLSENLTEADQAPKDIHKEAVIASAAEGRRLYIGNLAYATTELELQTFFEGYLIESTSIPKNPRTDRPVGYAFVDLSTSAEADRAIAELSGKEILERKVSVQLARKPEPILEKSATPLVETGSGGEGETRRRRTPGRGRGRGRAARAGRDAPAPQEKVAEPEANESVPLVAEAPDNQLAEKKEPKEKPVRIQRERRERGPPADGIPSKTKVMVANLPYDLSEEKLKEIFINYDPISAKIALRPIPRFMVKKLQARNEPRKGRGFGFVNLSSNEFQSKAVEEMNGKEIEGREIVVKIAIDSLDKVLEEQNAQTNGTTEGVANSSAGLNSNDDSNGDLAETNGVGLSSGINGVSEAVEVKA